MHRYSQGTSGTQELLGYMRYIEMYCQSIGGTQLMSGDIRQVLSWYCLGRSVKHILILLLGKDHENMRGTGDEIEKSKYLKQ